MGTNFYTRRYSVHDSRLSAIADRGASLGKVLSFCLFLLIPLILKCRKLMTTSFLSLLLFFSVSFLGCCALAFGSNYCSFLDLLSSIFAPIQAWFFGRVAICVRAARSAGLRSCISSTIISVGNQRSTNYILYCFLC